MKLKNFQIPRSNTLAGDLRSPAKDRSFYGLLLQAASLVFILIAVAFFWALISGSWSIWSTQPLSLLTGSDWSGHHGGLPMIVGTLQSSFIALIIAVVLGLGTAITVVFLIPRRLQIISATFIELLAGIPSIIYGVWGSIILAPWMLAHFYPWVNSLGIYAFGDSTTLVGPSLFLASIVLAVMILPIFVSITRDVIAAVPQDLIEASLSLGATKWQVITKTVLPTAKIGIAGAAFLALARATGETVAVALTIGGIAHIEWKLFLPATTIASFIASSFGEASSTDIQALLALGVVLMVISLTISFLSRMLIARQRKALARV
ncbi:MAG: phosphate ABC transporter permease subunit PstC [Actinomycetota bacterium]